MKYVNKFYKFMRFRYGIDELYRFLLCLYIVIAIVHLFISSRILSAVELVIFMVMLYKVFSKNISKRKKENEKYLKLKKKIMRPIQRVKRDYQDREYCIYHKCRYCKVTLKLPIPSKRGIKHVTCPNCKKRITMLVLRKQKIEVIKKKG